jgi:hypothetical protein
MRYVTAELQREKALRAGVTKATMQLRIALFSE